MAHELALGIVRGGEGATKLVAITVTRRRHRRGRLDGGPRHRQLAAREDRGARRRSQLGTAGRGGGPLGARPSCSTRARQIGHLVLFENGRPFDELAPQAAEYLKGDTLEIEVNLGAGGTHSATVWTCDLVGRIREDQRRIPNVGSSTSQGQSTYVHSTWCRSDDTWRETFSRFWIFTPIALAKHAGVWA